MNKQTNILTVFLAIFYIVFFVAGEIQPKEEDRGKLAESIISKIDGHELHILNSFTKSFKVDIDFTALFYNPILFKAGILQVIDKTDSFLIPLSGTYIFFYVLINAP